VGDLGARRPTATQPGDRQATDYPRAPWRRDPGGPRHPGRVVVIVVAVVVVLLVLIVSASMRGRQKRGAERRTEDQDRQSHN